MSTENIVSKKFRLLSDATNKVWNRISFWTKASDVEFDSGSNAQTTLGSITGISDSLTSTSSNVAASAASVKALNDKITELSSNLGGIKSLTHIASAIAINTTKDWTDNLYSYVYNVTNYDTVYIFGLRVADYGGRASTIYIDEVAYETYQSGTVKDYIEIDTKGKSTIKINIYSNYETNYLGGIYGK